MSEIRERIAAHRKDVLVLLQQASRTALLHSGFRLAGAVSHLARAQALLGEELEGLPGGSKQEGAPAERSVEATDEDDTPIDGLRRG